MASMKCLSYKLNGFVNDIDSKNKKGQKKNAPNDLSNIESHINKDIKIFDYHSQFYNKLTKYFEKQNIIYGIINIDLHNYFVKKNKSYDVYNWVSDVLYESSFDVFVDDCMVERKDIFLTMDYENYALYHKEKKYPIDIQRHFYDHHRAFIYLKYKPNDTYTIYYINSHGIDMLDYNFFYNIFSSTRATYEDFNKPVERIILENMVNYVNAPLNFNWSEENVYLGPNLQDNDNIGLCFFISFIMHDMFIKDILFRPTTNITTSISYRVNKYLRNVISKKGTQPAPLLTGKNKEEYYKTVTDYIGSRKYQYTYYNDIIDTFLEWIDKI